MRVAIMNYRKFRIHNFEQIFWPIKLFSKFLILPAHTPKITKIKVKEVFYTIILLLLYTWLVSSTMETILSLQRVYRKIAMQCNPTFTDIVHQIHDSIASSSIYFTVFLHYINFNLVNKILMEIRKIDNKIMKRFGTDFQETFNYGKLKKKTFISLFFLESILWTELLSELSKIPFPEYTKVLILRGIWEQFYWFIIFQYLFYIYLIQQRFSFCNNFLNKFIVKSKPNTQIIFLSDFCRAGINFPGKNAEHTRLSLTIIFEIHDTCYELSKKLNYLYGFQVLIILTTSFLDSLLLSHAIFCLLGLAQLNHPVGFLYVFLISGIKIFVLIKILNDTAVKANYTKIILHRIRNKITDVREYVSKSSSVAYNNED